MNDLIENIDKIHITDVGAEHIKRNSQIETDNIVEWCRAKILDKNAEIEKIGTNWFIVAGSRRITVNSNSYTIITAHRVK